MSNNYIEIYKCRICQSSNLDKIFTLGNLAISDFLDKVDFDNEKRAPLDLVICDPSIGGCGLVQLKHTVSSDALYRNYWYQSGINKTMTDELKNITDSIKKLNILKSGDLVIDIGSNDGTLLRSYDISGLITVGFEPAKNLYDKGSHGTYSIICDFFDEKIFYERFGSNKARVITAIGMFYDLDDPNKFVSDIYNCLSDDGLFIIQMMYVPFAIERNAFDGICHEHLEYYSLTTLEFLLNNHSLEIVDVELRKNINEGSIRFFIQKKMVPTINLAYPQQTLSVSKLRDAEYLSKITDISTYRELFYRIENAKLKTIEFILDAKKKGKIVHGYAASTKGNTTLQYYGLTDMLIDVIADRNPVKWGKYTSGSHIKVVSEEVSRAQNPDYYFVLAWHFLPEFLSREVDFVKKGGKFIVSMPEFRII